MNIHECTPKYFPDDVIVHVRRVLMRIRLVAPGTPLSRPTQNRTALHVTMQRDARRYAFRLADTRRACSNVCGLR